MSATILVKFGTHDFSTDAVDFSLEGEMKISLVDVPKRHGAVIQEVPTIGPRYATIRGMTVGASVEAARTSYLNMLKELINGRQALRIYSDRFWYAMLHRWTPVPAPGTGGEVINWTVQFLLDDPFLYDDTSDSKEQVISSSPKSFTVDNNGDIYVFPVVTVTADQGSAVAGFTLKHGSTGKQFKYNGTIGLDSTNSKSVVVDMSNFLVTNGGTPDLPNMDLTSEFFWLESGEQTITFTGSNCTVTVAWRPRYLW